jgi:hypothetical protein
MAEKHLSECTEKLTEKMKLVDHLNNRLNEKTSYTRSITAGGFSGNFHNTSSGLSSIASTSRDLNMESRLKYSNNNFDSDKQEKPNRIDGPIIKRYTGTTPVKERENGNRTLSPSMNVLNQQLDPED